MYILIHDTYEILISLFLIVNNNVYIYIYILYICVYICVYIYFQTHHLKIDTLQKNVNIFSIHF